MAGRDKKKESAKKVRCREHLKDVLQIFGSKWSFEVICALQDGPVRFNELCRQIGCSTRSLSNTLKHLEKHGIICRQVMPTSPVTVEYSLSASGRDFEPVFREMSRWGERWQSAGARQPAEEE